MKILHTSDWHLGHNLMIKDRKSEHRQFLSWLTECLTTEEIDILIVAGDIFDSGTPPNYALQLYYQFLQKIPDSPCKHVVIIGGNHDSVSTLHAPKEVLKLLQIHVIGGVTDNLEDELLLLKHDNGDPMAIVCAVPFLRDRDVRKSVAGESYEEKNRALFDGIKSHYHQLRDKALEVRNTSQSKTYLPLLATGHLFTAGGKVSDGIREIYVGSLGQISASSFPDEFDYIALGHLHRPQKVGGLDHICYSGSPIPLSFSEARNPKSVIIADFDSNGTKDIKTLPVPCFQELKLIKGTLEKIEFEINEVEIKVDQSPIWLEIQLDTEKWTPGIHESIKEMVQEKPFEILAIKRLQNLDPKRLTQTEKYETLEELTPEAVFKKRLSMETMDDENEIHELTQAFNDIYNQSILKTDVEDK